MFHLQTHLDELPIGSGVTRESLGQVLGIGNRPKITPSAELLSATEYPTYTEQKYALAVGDGVLAPMYLLVPRSEPPYTPILAFHGHNPSVQFILGHYPDPETEAEKLNVDNNFAQRLAQAGYLVCAVEQRGMGERVTNLVADGEVPGSCRQLAFYYQMHGRTLLGERVWDGMCAIDYLQTRDDVRFDALGCTGHSGGGTTTLFLSALDQRIKAAVVSCYFCAFEQSILGVWHCECNYVPNLLSLGNAGDIAALIAPRPLCIINGRHDPIFPIDGVTAQFPIVERAYDDPAACQLYIHDGAHAYHVPTSRAWFERWL